MVKTLGCVSLILVLYCTAAHGQQSAFSSEAALKACQEQLADVRGAVTKIHQTTAAFQAETLVTLDRKLTEAQAHATQQAATITEKQQALDTVSAQLAEAKAQQTNDAATIAGLREELALHTTQSQDTARASGAR